MANKNIVKVLYWNIKTDANLEYAIQMAGISNPDVMFLSEVTEGALVKSALPLERVGYEHFPNPGCKRVQIIKRRSVALSLGIQGSRFTSVFIDSLSLHIVSVHMKSQTWTSLDELRYGLNELRLRIDGIGASSETRILVLGDFNVNPFDLPMTAYDGFGATNSHNTTTAQITGSTKSLYFNPTWQLYSRTHCPGTYYHRRPSNTSFDVLDYHYLDQVLISEKLKDDLLDQSMEIIENVIDFSLVDAMKHNEPKTDHLPLSYELQLP